MKEYEFRTEVNDLPSWLPLKPKYGFVKRTERTLVKTKQAMIHRITNIDSIPLVCNLLFHELWVVNKNNDDNQISIDVFYAAEWKKSVLFKQKVLDRYQ